MIEDLWDGAALNTVEREHLSLCAECQQQFATLALLRDEFAVARQSTVRPEAENRLFAMFEQLREKDSLGNPIDNLLGTISSWVNALPLWDSRQQAGMVGIRNANRSSYRLLFGAQETEIELLVESQNGLLRVTGEVMVAEREGSNGLALVELMTSADAKSAIEAESDVHGRFSLDRVPPGIYTMTITPRYSHMVVIEPLELT
jgi:hypothetical protein